LISWREIERITNIYSNLETIIFKNAFWEIVH